MGLTTSLYTGLSGLNGNAQLIDVTGDNIANSNTLGFKSSRMTFETQISQLLRPGSAPSADSGGSNPAQIGLGVTVGSVTRSFKGGSLQTTGRNTDVAIEGDGFLIVNAEGGQRYTRAGNLGLDSSQNLVRDGDYVLGYGVDEDFNVVPGNLTKLNVPLGALTLAEATTNVMFSGNLNAGGAASTTGSVINSQTLYSDAGATTQAVGTDLLTGLFNQSGQQLFQDGDVLTISGATRGGAALPDSKFQIGAANTTTSDDNGETLEDFMAFLQDITGIDDDLGDAGVTVSNGQLTIKGNGGRVNDLDIQNADIVLNAGGANPGTPFEMTKTATADGESVRTTFLSYDSLGKPMTIDLSLTLEQKSNAGTRWRFFANSIDNSGPATFLGSGTMDFDTSGLLTLVADNDVLIDRSGTGARTPQAITLKFSDQLGSVSSIAASTSQISAINQDGAPIGTLQDFSFSEDGTLVGVFSNGILRDIGRLAIAKFTNPTGLLGTSGNLFAETRNSGSASIVTAGTGGAGRVVGGALELSNVDLSQEFINLISASTGFNANSRVLSTADQLMQQLLNTLR